MEVVRQLKLENHIPLLERLRLTTVNSFSTPGCIERLNEAGLPWGLASLLINAAASKRTRRHGVLKTPSGDACHEDDESDVGEEEWEVKSSEGESVISNDEWREDEEEAIVYKNAEDGRYLVKWKGYTHAENTWENPEVVPVHLLHKYENDLINRRTVMRPQRNHPHSNSEENNETSEML